MLYWATRWVPSDLVIRGGTNHSFVACTTLRPSRRAPGGPQTPLRVARRSWGQSGRRGGRCNRMWERGGRCVDSRIDCLLHVRVRLATSVAFAHRARHQGDEVTHSPRSCETRELGILVASLKHVSIMLSLRRMSREEGITRATQSKILVWSEVSWGSGTSYVPNDIAMHPRYHLIVQQCST